MDDLKPTQREPLGASSTSPDLSCRGRAASVGTDLAIGDSEEAARGAPAGGSHINAAGNSTCDLSVSGMTCPSCVMHVEKALERVPGVVSASVDLRGGSARVNYRPDAVDIDELKQAIRAVGYEAKSAGPAAAPIRRWRYAWPLAIFAALAVFLGIGLTRDPRLVPSPLIDKPVPNFALPPVQGRTLGLASADLRGEVAVVNVFASWCTACRDEHPLWMELAKQRALPIQGLNYKDAPNDAARWLDQLGDPYTRTGADRDGRVGIEWGVYGVPETFVVDKHGVIRDKIIGPITRKSVDERLLPLVRRLRAE